MPDISVLTNLGAMSAKRFMEINDHKVARATDDLASGSRVSNPANDPSAAAIGFRLTADITVKQQASRNASQAISMLQQATGGLGSTQQVLTRMKEIAGQANSSLLGPSDLSKLNNEFSTLINQIDLNVASVRFGGVQLFGGGAGTSTFNGALAQGGANMVAAAGAGAAGNGFAAGLQAGTQGYITGSVTNAFVTANGANYNFTLQVGSQTFTGTTSSVANGTNITMTSTSNNSNVVVMQLGTNVAAATGGNSATTLTTIFRQALGLDTGVAASFTSLSSNSAAFTGGQLAFSAGAGTTPGTWAVTYTANGGTGTFQLTNGVETYNSTISYTGATPVTQTVNFDNGASLSLAAFVGNANIAQNTFTVTAGTSINQQFQIGELGTDILGITFNGAGSVALGVNGLNVLTPGNAQTASGAIDLAMKTVSTYIAQLGGKSSQLGFLIDNLKVSIQNQSAQLGTFTNTNMAEALDSLQKNKALSSVASTVFSNALQNTTKIAQLVSQAAQ